MTTFLLPRPLTRWIESVSEEKILRAYRDDFACVLSTDEVADMDARLAQAAEDLEFLNAVFDENQWPHLSYEEMIDVHLQMMQQQLAGLESLANGDDQAIKRCRRRIGFLTGSTRFWSL